MDINFGKGHHSTQCRIYWRFQGKEDLHFKIYICISRILLQDSREVKTAGRPGEDDGGVEEVEGAVGMGGSQVHQEREFPVVFQSSG